MSKKQIVVCDLCGEEVSSPWVRLDIPNPETLKAKSVDVCQDCAVAIAKDALRSFKKEIMDEGRR